MATVVFEDEGVTVSAPQGGRVMDLADEHPATAVPFSCRFANCGTCRVEVTEGLELCEPATEREARDLARALVATARGAGCPTDACITGMDAPLLPVAGNALEIAASMEVLTGAAPHPALRQLVEVLGGRLLVLGGLAGDDAGGAAAIARALDSGRAAEVFGAMVAHQGGPADFVARWRAHLPVAPVQAAVPAPAGGVIERWDTRALGLAIVALGGGRAREGDAIDHRVGLAGILPVGARVASGEPVAIVHAADEAGAARARQAVAAAVRVGPGPAAPRPLIHGWV